jgi:dihydroorotate dehydrogenase (NAD+) catalytic subunit
MADLKVELAGLCLNNPVLAASGCFGFGQEYNAFFPIRQVGGIMVKGLTLNPCPGNPTPRIAETPAGMLNSIGLQNPGIDNFLSHELPWLIENQATVIANINGHSLEDFDEIARRLSGVSGIHAIEINISCPNVSHGGLYFGTDPRQAAAVTERVRKHTKIPLIVKLSPNVTDITAIAKAVVDAGADIISLINTLLGMAININTRKPLLARQVGGLSGPAIKPVALRMVWQVAQSVTVPIIGMGGICSAEDAIEFLLAGASAVAVGCGNFIDPYCIPNIIRDLDLWLNKEGYSSVSDIVGLACKQS